MEKFAFTKVFEEEASQLDIFHGTGVIPLVEGVVAAKGGDGRDGLLATLGVTGSGKVRGNFFFSSFRKRFESLIWGLDTDVEDRVTLSSDPAASAALPNSPSTSSSVPSRATSSIRLLPTLSTPL